MLRVDILLWVFPVTLTSCSEHPDEIQEFNLFVGGNNQCGPARYGETALLQGQNSEAPQ
jgi:hypothetical protein